jgi:small-conductance mechanosensitive channel
MQKRRVVFELGVTYQTGPDVLQTIPQLLKNIILKQKDIIFDRAHFSSFGDFSLNFEIVYYVLSSDYNIYMDKQQAIYFDIFKTFEKNGIDFAYPTQTVFVNGQLQPAENFQMR